jgi:hypothetical protein
LLAEIAKEFSLTHAATAVAACGRGSARTMRSCAAKSRAVPMASSQPVVRRSRSGLAVMPHWTPVPLLDSAITATDADDRPSPMARVRHDEALGHRPRSDTMRPKNDTGSATAEYAIATMAAVGFAGLLVVIMKSDEVRGILTDLVRSALTFGG